MKKTSIAVLTLGLLALLPNISFATGSSCVPVGSYTMNISAPGGMTSYGVFEIHIDGTMTSHHSFNLTQKYQGPDHVGGYATIQVGQWKPVSSTVFKIVNTCVDLARDADNPALPARPVSREKGTVTFKFNSDCKTGTFAGNIDIYPIPPDNLGLSGTPVTSITISGNFQRVSGP